MQFTSRHLLHLQAWPVAPVAQLPETPILQGFCFVISWFPGPTAGFWHRLPCLGAIAVAVADRSSRWSLSHPLQLCLLMVLATGLVVPGAILHSLFVIFFWVLYSWPRATRRSGVVLPATHLRPSWITSSLCLAMLPLFLTEMNPEDERTAILLAGYGGCCSFI